MVKFKIVNGWTKAKMIGQIMARNNNTVSRAGVLGDEKDEDKCMYRGDNGNACALGCFIPDDKYNKVMEGMPVSAIMRELPNILPFNNTNALLKMQKVHDNSENGEVHQALINFILNECEE